MNLLEYENSIFGDLWNEETIKELKESEPKRSYKLSPLFRHDSDDEEYQEYLRANFEEYFDPAHTYKYCLWK